MTTGAMAMVRRILVMVVACGVFGGCLAMAGRAEREGYAILPAADTMSTAEVQASLEAVGLHVDRFAYEVPLQHDLRVRIDEYREGKLMRSVLDTTGRDLAAGTHRLLLFARRGEGGMQFSLSDNAADGHRGITSDAKVSLAGLQTTSWQGARGNRLTVGQPVELCRFYGDLASAPRATGGDLKTAVATHDVVVVVSATLSTR
jgi:hypothetical protein